MIVEYFFINFYSFLSFLPIIFFSKLLKYKIAITIRCHIVVHHWEIETLVIIFHFQELEEADDEQTIEAPETE